MHDVVRQFGFGVVALFVRRGAAGSGVSLLTVCQFINLISSHLSGIIIQSSYSLLVSWSCIIYISISYRTIVLSQLVQYGSLSSSISVNPLRAAVGGRTRYRCVFKGTPHWDQNARRRGDASCADDCLQPRVCGVPRDGGFIPRTRHCAAAPHNTAAAA